LIAGTGRLPKATFQGGKASRIDGVDATAGMTGQLVENQWVEMRQTILVVDGQSMLSPPEWLVSGCQKLAKRISSVATIELHDESRTPFLRVAWLQSGSRAPKSPGC